MRCWLHTAARKVSRLFMFTSARATIMPLPRNKRPLTALELEEIALNLDFDQSDLDDLSSDDDEDEVDLGLENVVTDPDDMEIADNMSDEEETPPLKQRKVQPVPDRRVRTVGNIHLPVFTKQEQKTRSKCRFPKCGKLTFAKCNSCNIYLCCTVDRNCFSLFHQ
ncbi:uncharacterized protein LOC123677880 [Harmonia axyridis]|uniref:uncharacterized protein LOC123677880 n=1 Tax=Harmonia axyridis TaxID=115357 RepID=UPI001E2761F6|nr:uncharacterized protein LOC123677880 [Harmonia axyridis]